MKLSVIFPTYNRFNMLLKSVASVCQVAQRPLEVIVVDDGSKDGTTDRSEEIKVVCESAGAEFQFIRQSNAGAAAARNTGWKHATGDLIQWVDSDDVVVPEGVDVLVEELKRDGDIDLAYGLVRIVDAEGCGTQTMGKRPEGWETDYFDYLWHTMAAVYRTGALKRVGWWAQGLVLGDDWEFSSRVRIAGCRYRFIDIVVGNYVHHGGDALTTTKFNAAKCYNVIEATLSLRDAFVKSERYTPYIQQRCFNRVFVHALELASEKSDLSRNAFSRCREIGSPNLCLKVLSSCMRLLPSCFLHRVLFVLLRKNGDGTLRSMLQSSSAQPTPPPPQQAGQVAQGDHVSDAVVGKVCLTAICPTYNRSSLVGEAITSFLSHSPDDWEMIVVDDGSEDDTIQKIEELQKRLSPKTLTLLKQGTNLGAPKARNAGLLLAQGRYVMFVDSDDRLEASGVSALVNALERSTADYAYGIVEKTFTASGAAHSMGRVGSEWRGDNGGIADFNWQTMGAVYRKGFLLERVGQWNTELNCSQDWEYQARVKLSGARGVFVHALVGYWNQSGEDRIGHQGYNKQYIESVMLAVLSIAECAKRFGRLDQELRKRLYFRLLNHMVEASANRDYELAKRVGDAASRVEAGSIYAAMKFLLLICFPRWLSALLLRSVRRHQMPTVE
jgi:glycosyltransferase involved in cell wall biosynthesis